MAKKVVKAATGNWFVGQKVKKVFHGIGGYRETDEGVITKIDNKTCTIYVDDEWGITYGFNGREKENFFPGMHKTIEPMPS